VAASPGLVTGAEAEADALALGAADAELSAELDAAADVVGALVDGLDVAVESSLPHPTNNPLAATASAPTAIDRRKVVLIRECCGIYFRPCFPSRCLSTGYRRSSGGNLVRRTRPRPLRVRFLVRSGHQ